MNQSAVAVRTCRILYYGPSGAGKRENLRQIADSIPPEHRLQVATDDPSRHIAFRLRSGSQGDWTVFIQSLDTGREMYFQGSDKSKPPFDGVVFVAQSTAARLDQSLSSLEALKAYIDGWNLDIMSVPMVIQYNRLGEGVCLAVDRLESLLNPWGLLSFPASTAQVEGVKETLKAILSLTISQILQDESKRGVSQTGTRSARERQTAPESKLVTVAPDPNIHLDTDQPHVNHQSEAANFQVVSEDRSGFFFDELRPPIVIPVRIPRKLLDKYGSARIILEVELDDGDSILC